MNASTIGDFPIYSFLANEDVPDDLDPMCYQVLMKVKEDHYVYRAFCQGIPCEYCLLSAKGCSPGAEQTHIVAYVRNELPELYI